MNPLSARRRFAAAFTLVEVALAMGVASFCLIAVVGLVPVGVNSSQLASDQTAAGSILTHVLADLRATPMTLPPGTAAVTSKEYGLSIPYNPLPPLQPPTTPKPATLYFGSITQQFSSTKILGDSRYRLTVTYFPPVVGRAPTEVTLLVTWPAQVDPTNPATGTPAGRVQTFAALDRN